MLRSEILEMEELQAAVNKVAETLIPHMLKPVCHLDEARNRFFPGVSRRDSSPAKALLSACETQAVRPAESLGFLFLGSSR